MQTQHLAVHLEHGATGLIGDIGVLAKRDETLSDDVHLYPLHPAGFT
jgi:hypothetical protein